MRATRIMTRTTRFSIFVVLLLPTFGSNFATLDKLWPLYWYAICDIVPFVTGQYGEFMPDSTYILFPSRLAIQYMKYSSQNYCLFSSSKVYQAATHSFTATWGRNYLMSPHLGTHGLVDIRFIRLSCSYHKDIIWIVNVWDLAEAILKCIL